MPAETTPEKIEPSLWTIAQVCAFLNISRAEFYRLDQRGRFAPLSIGLCAKRLYLRSEIENWAKMGCVPRKQWQEIKKSAGTERGASSAKTINIQNSNVILGNVQQPENLQVGNNTFVQKHPKIKKIGIISFIATFLTILHLLGWLGPVKEFFGKILWPK